MSKYKKYFQEMFQAHKELFTSFKEIHDQYVGDEEAWKKEFNTVGKQVVEVIREYERMLCAKSDSGQYSKYSSNLADKFWTEVRSYYPRIDFVGVM